MCQEKFGGATSFRCVVAGGYLAFLLEAVRPAVAEVVGGYIT